MKWKKEVPKEGVVRTITRFLFAPKRIGEDGRWLEFASIMQHYQKKPNMFAFNRRGWANTRWVPNKPVSILKRIWLGLRILLYFCLAAYIAGTPFIPEALNPISYVPIFTPVWDSIIFSIIVLIAISLLESTVRIYQINKQQDEQG